MLDLLSVLLHICLDIVFLLILSVFLYNAKDKVFKIGPCSECSFNDFKALIWPVVRKPLTQL